MPDTEKYTVGNVVVTRNAATLALVPSAMFLDQFNVVICGVQSLGRPLVIGHVHETSDSRWNAILTGPAGAGGLCAKGTYSSLRDALTSMQKDADYYLARTGL